MTIVTTLSIVVSSSLFTDHSSPPRYTSGFLGSPYSSSLFSQFPQSPLPFHFPLATTELERLERQASSPSLPDSPASPIVMERNEYCRK